MTKRSLDATVAVVGLDCVGLLLAVAFGRRFCTIGRDLLVEKIAHRRRFGEPTNEMTSRELCVVHEPLRDYLPKVVDGGGIANVKSVLDRHGLE